MNTLSVDDTSQSRLLQDRYRKMVDEVDDYAIILLDGSGIIQNWNKGAEKIKGYTEGEAVGRSFKMFYQQGDLENGLPDQLLNIARSSGKAHHEGWRLRKDQSRFWGSVVITALYASDDVLIGFTKVTKDLTEKKIAADYLEATANRLRLQNKALMESETRFNRMVAEVQDYALIMLDPHGFIIDWNKGAEKINQFQRDEVLKKHFRIFYPETDQRDKLPESLLKLADDTGRAAHEGWRVRKDGSLFWAYVVITALHDDDNKIIGYSKVTRDLTERKAWEDQMLAYTKELERRNEDLEQFAYVAAHDMQEPLRKISTFVDLLEHGSASMDNAELLRRIRGSAGRMSDLIRSVLNYSRLAKEDKLQVVELNDVVADVISDYDLLIKERNATITFDNLPSITGARSQITQLFTNLIANSIKYCVNDPLIVVSSRRVRASEMVNQPEGVTGRFFEICITDNGIGFDEKYVDKIFAIFQRLHAKQTYAGTGIGLALCRKVMVNHGGFITARSEPNVGSRFLMYFPIH